MHNIKTNFDKFYEIVKSSLQIKLNEDDNLKFYPNKPKMNDCSIIALCICAESIGIDSENYFSPGGVFTASTKNNNAASVKPRR
jgi:hypothetical protein